MEDMGARIVGKLSPSVGTLDATADEEILDAIEKANPDILLVALGSPKQEIWIDRNRHRLKVPVCVGIGSALDFISGKIGRAPIWMQRACLEWCYRLWQEPRRLAPRYLKDALFMTRYFSVQLAVSVLKPRSGQTLRMAVESIGPVNILSASGMMTGSRLAQLEHAALRVAEKSEALVINHDRRLLFGGGWHTDVGPASQGHEAQSILAGRPAAGTGTDADSLIL